MKGSNGLSRETQIPRSVKKLSRLIELKKRDGMPDLRGQFWVEIDSQWPAQFDIG